MKKTITPMNPDSKPATGEVKPDWTPAQEAKRRRWAETLCTSAQNEASQVLARKLCHSWFPKCQCVENRSN